MTALLWGILPVTLKLTLEQLDALTITAFRFVSASIVVGAFLGFRRALPPLSVLRTSAAYGPLAAASLALAGNYILYLWGVQLTTPANAQVLIQLAPLLFALSGVFIFREKFVSKQWAGLSLLMVSLGIFFIDHLDIKPDHLSNYVLGSTLIILAAISWAVYAIFQKQLLTRMSSASVMLAIYVFCSVLFAPLAKWSALMDVDAWHLGMLVLCAANTIVAYGAFAEALAHWDASRVSAVVALAPIFTVAIMLCLNSWWPGFTVHEPLSKLGILAACGVVTGSMTVALARSRASRPT